ncbi:hypothetical protein AVEN_261795-1 [Araneus ventricosus]|uniref:Uncharacterized protein n=1 Tax=Araneus ventricosus TaxID=182803 RepID=A0A4Y2M1W0_ARAVE|nr:hypothetical protein AVEN_261795-1 [Araneus ventricosus]
MEPVRVYVPAQASVPTFLQNAHDAQLVALVRTPEECITVERKSVCACHSTDRLVVKNRCMIVPKDEHVVSAFPCYAAPADCTPDELLTIVAWITRHRFMTFECDLHDRHFDRYIAPNSLFQKRPHASCDTCEEHHLKGEPVFCTKRIVLSAQNKGPTVESVL